MLYPSADLGLPRCERHLALPFDRGPPCLAPGAPICTRTRHQFFARTAIEPEHRALPCQITRWNTRPNRSRQPTRISEQNLHRALLRVQRLDRKMSPTPDAHLLQISLHRLLRRAPVAPLKSLTKGHGAVISGLPIDFAEDLRRDRLMNLAHDVAEKCRGISTICRPFKLRLPVRRPGAPIPAF